MNNCILMAEIVQEPQLRFTTDNTALAEMLVEFPGLNEQDPPATLKVVGWGNLAQEIQQRYHPGDRVIIEGRLSMNTIERSEGFKEKRAELVVGKIYSLNGDFIAATPNVNTSTQPDGAVAKSNVVPLERRQQNFDAPKPANARSRDADISPPSYAPVEPLPKNKSADDYEDFTSAPLPKKQPDDYDPIPF